MVERNDNTHRQEALPPLESTWLPILVPLMAIAVFVGCHVNVSPSDRHPSFIELAFSNYSVHFAVAVSFSAGLVVAYPGFNPDYSTFVGRRAICALALYPLLSFFSLVKLCVSPTEAAVGVLAILVVINGLVCIPRLRTHWRALLNVAFYGLFLLVPTFHVFALLSQRATTFGTPVVRTFVIESILVAGFIAVLVLHLAQLLGIALRAIVAREYENVRIRPRFVLPNRFSLSFIFGITAVVAVLAATIKPDKIDLGTLAVIGVGTVFGIVNGLTIVYALMARSDYCERAWALHGPIPLPAEFFADQALTDELAYLCETGAADDTPSGIAGTQVSTETPVAEQPVTNHDGARLELPTAGHADTGTITSPVIAPSLEISSPQALVGDEENLLLKPDPQSNSELVIVRPETVAARSG